MAQAEIAEGPLWVVMPSAVAGAEAQLYAAAGDPRGRQPAGNPTMLATAWPRDTIGTLRGSLRRRHAFGRRIRNWTDHTAARERRSAEEIIATSLAAGRSTYVVTLDGQVPDLPGIDPETCISAAEHLRQIAGNDFELAQQLSRLAARLPGTHNPEQLENHLTAGLFSAAESDRREPLASPPRTTAGLRGVAQALVSDAAELASDTWERLAGDKTGGAFAETRDLAAIVRERRAAGAAADRAAERPVRPRS